MCARLAPAAVDPEPLLRMLAYPAFNHRGDRLHRALHINPAFRIAPRLYRPRKLGTKAIAIRQTHDAGPIDGTFDMAGETGNERVGLAWSAEEGHVDAIDVILVNEHGHVSTPLQNAGKLERCVQTGGHKGPHAAFADLDDSLAHGNDVWPAIKDCCVEGKLGGDKRRQLPIGKMRSKDQRGLAILAQALEALSGLERVADVAGLMPRRREDLQAIDVSKFRGNAPEIIPNAPQDVFDFGFRFLRKSGGQIGAADAMFPKPRAKGAHECRGHIWHRSPIDGADRSQRPNGEPAQQRVDGGLELSPGVRGIEGDHARGCRASKTDDDLPEHLPAFKAGQSPIEFGKRDLGVDHWQEPARHLGETLADIA